MIWRTAKPYLIGAGLIVGWLVVSNNDFRAAVEYQHEHEARVTDLCRGLGKEPARDNDGELVCMDSAPSFVLGRPIGIPR